MNWLRRINIIGYIIRHSYLLYDTTWMDPKKISTLSVVILQGVVGGLVNKCQSGKFFWVHPVLHSTHFNVFMGVLNILRYIMVLQYQHYLPRVVLLHPTHFNVFMDILNILRFMMVLHYQQYLPRVVLLHPTHFNVFMDVLNILSTWWHMMSTWWHYTTNITYLE